MSTVEKSIPALMAPPPKRDNPLTRSVAGILGIAFIAVMLGASLLSLPWTFGKGEVPWYAASAPPPEASSDQRVRRYNAGVTAGARLPPFWVAPDRDARLKLNALVPAGAAGEIAAAHDLKPADLPLQLEGPAAEALREHWPAFPLGTDGLGRDLFVRCLAGGSVSLTIGLLAALLSVTIGTLYGALAGYIGGTVDAVMMRIVDVLYGLPYVLLVVLLAVASDSLVDDYISRSATRSGWVRAQAAEVLRERGEAPTKALIRRELTTNDSLRERLEAEAGERFPARQMGELTRTSLDLATLLIAIGGVSWLTMARVIRGQVLSLKARPFMEAARAIGVPVHRQFFVHLLPNLLGPIIVYATLTVPQAILQESFLSFLGIGVKPPIPSWGNLAAEGLTELNRHKSHWWTLLFPCLLLGATLLSLNFVGEGLREAFDPRRSRR